MMCSIPGLPTPGSAVPVLVTRVNLKPNGGLVELWVDLNVERKQDYEQMKKDIEIPEKTLCGSEGKPGDLCLVCISDTWHRARIVSIQSETCSVFLIDQGQLHISTCHALAWAPNDSFLLPPKTESCILANVFSTVNDWPERATKFLMSLSGKIFHGVVQHVLMPDRIILLDIPIISKHICKAGVAKKIPKGDFKSLVLKCLNLPKDHPSDTGGMTQDLNLNGSCQYHKTDQYFYPELLNDSYEYVSVTEATGPRNIFCKLFIFSSALKTQSDEIQRHYDEPTDLGEARPWICGDACAARGKDGRWHRSLLMQNIVTSDRAVKVLHVDEGTTEYVPVADIQPLLGKFLRMPVVTYRCWINGVDDGVTEWTVDHTRHLKSLLLNRKVVARFRPNNRSQNVYDVDLFALNGTCINDCFLEDGHLSPPETDRQLNGLNDTIASSLISLHQDEQCVDIQIKKPTVNEETLPSTKEQPFNGTADDAPTPGTNDGHSRDHTEHCDPPIYPSGHLSTCCPVQLQDAPPDDMFTVGSTVNVEVSCIESPQKFWCQIPENAHSLKLITEGLQNLYASAYPPPLVESICVARDPESGMWHRAKIITSPCCPEVEVRFIDYGQTRKVSLGDLRPIDPAFLQFNMQAFQCSLLTPDNHPAVTETKAALAEFQTFVDSAVSSHAGLQCIVKARTCDEEGLMVSMVDLITPSDSACELLAQKCARAAPESPADGYNYSTFDINVGGEEKVWVTASENVNHFYCQLERNAHIFDKVQENVKQVIGQTQLTDQLLTLNSVCLARYTDRKWYRGQVVEMSPRLKVHFVDYGDTLELSGSDLRPYPANASIAQSVPAQAVPLALLDVPDDVPQEVNQWFVDHSVGCTFSISVAAKGERGKLIVELFDDSLNVNMKVIERIARIKERKMAGQPQQAREPDKEELDTMSPSERMTEEDKVPSSNERCAGDELKINSHSATLVSASDVQQERTVEEVRNPTVDELKGNETVLRESFIQNVLTDLQCTPTCLSGDESSSSYTKPNISLNKTEEGYASCIVGPNYFWCQSVNTDTLNMVSMLAQEVGQTHQDQVFTKTVDRGSPCLALFSSDNQWYRAQVIRRTDKTLHVLFVDYGNESEVDLKDVRSVPQYLLEQAPQAFLCSLSGFDEAEGSWDDGVYDDFYNRLADKPLRVTAVVNMEDRKDVGVPQYAVEAECEGVLMNALVQKYWKPAVKQCLPTENTRTETICLEVQTESSIACVHVKSCMFTKLQMSKKQTDIVYASCIVGPSFFWCQYATTEELSDMSRLAQEAAEAQQDVTFTETLGPGGPCLALFDSDNQWYRAQVMHRESERVHVVFIDYGNESDVEIKNVRRLPQYLLEQAPQAFLCSLTGFDEAEGSWDDGVYDDFYNRLVDKQLRVTNVFHMEDHKQIAFPHYAVEIECEGVKVNAAMHRYWKPVVKKRTARESPHIETFVQNVQTEASITKAAVPTAYGNPYVYKKPQVSQNRAETVYASCIVGPSFFWCQYAATEELSKVSRLAQEAAEAQQDVTFTETLGPGGPCLALFDSDNQWYRAQVIRRLDDKFSVVFIDYGNESEVDLKDVRWVPQYLLEQAPQAFLCSLTGFDEAEGSWDDGVYDDFYNLLVDKPLEVSVFNKQDHSEIAVPQYAVEIKYQGVVVNEVMEKYWKRLL